MLRLKVGFGFDSIKNLSTLSSVKQFLNRIAEHAMSTILDKQKELLKQIPFKTSMLHIPKYINSAIITTTNVIQKNQLISLVYIFGLKYKTYLIPSVQKKKY